MFEFSLDHDDGGGGGAGDGGGENGGDNDGGSGDNGGEDDIMKTDHTLPLSWVSFSNEISLILTNALSSDSQEMSGEGEEGRYKYLAFTLCHLL